MRALPVPILSDNYAWLLMCERTGTRAIVDPAEAGPIIAAIEADRSAGPLATILLTHHHDDHVAATEEIRARYGARVVGARADRHRLPRLDEEVAEGDIVTVGETEGRVIETPGHTVGHVSYFFADGAVLLSGDTLFSLGCGRLFEGTPAMLHASLGRFADLPDETLVCCGHEYTATNARYALTVDPDNVDLRRRADEVARLRAAGTPTLPARLGEERRCNPFLRAPDEAAFARLRAGRDGFRG